jgi:hypothetical protein
MDNLEQWNIGNLMQNLELSFLSFNERGNIVPKTPEVALIAAQAYLLTAQLAPGDPRESMHRACIQGLGLVGDKLQEGEAPRQEKSPRHHNSL